MKTKHFFILLSVCFFIFAASCNENSKKNNNNNCDSNSLTVHKYPEKIKNAVIYEVNIRQYTPEGTIKAFIEHIPRLSELGVDILWLMPIFPIGEKNKKGDLGSYYAVKNYTEVNPKFGTKEDLKKLVKEAHKNNMLVILDWVANHTAWDNKWIKENPQWYRKDSAGNIISPVDDWTDVADLNYQNKQMRAKMINSMKYWIKNFDIDGYRCDVAMMVPTDFWEQTREQLDSIKPVFMLAEAETDDLMDKAFDMNYSWELMHITQKIAKGKQKATDLVEYLKNDAQRFPQNVLRMTFTSNHDENSWNGTVYERYPNCYKTFAALTFVIRGLPLIYSGQEACLDKRLKFFYKDTIEWKNCDMTDFYKNLIKLKKENKALWNGKFGGEIEFVDFKKNEDIVSFIRKKDNNKILVAFNLSNQKTELIYTDKLAYDRYTNYFTNEQLTISADNNSLKMKPWTYYILIKK